MKPSLRMLAAVLVVSFSPSCTTQSGATRLPIATPASSEEVRRHDGPLVLVTIDGVRWQEIFEGTDPKLSGEPRKPASTLVPNLYWLASTNGAFVGAPGHGVIEASGPEHVSLPGYNEIFAGDARHGCANNDCPRTRSVTLLDDARSHGAKVAAFASWSKIDLALTAEPGAFLVSCGPRKLGGDGGEMRADRDTAAEALAYLESERPDVLYLGLGETDDFAHAGNYPAYVDALQRADEVVGRILGILGRDDWGRRAHVIVTPDHGRAKDFRSHGGIAPEAARVWMVAGGPQIAARGFVASPGRRHLADIAPTARLLVGLAPEAELTAGAGEPLHELFAVPTR